MVQYGRLLAHRIGFLQSGRGKILHVAMRFDLENGAYSVQRSLWGLSDKEHRTWSLSH
jgi:hypothetical protein